MTTFEWHKLIALGIIASWFVIAPILVWRANRRNRK